MNALQHVPHRVWALLALLMSGLLLWVVFNAASSLLASCLQRQRQSAFTHIATFFQQHLGTP